MARAALPWNVGSTPAGDRYAGATRIAKDPGGSMTFLLVACALFARRSKFRLQLAARLPASYHLRLWPLAVALCSLLVAPQSLSGAAPSQASSSRTVKNEAIKAIPLAKLDPQDRAEVSAIVKNTSIFRRMPVQVTECDPHLYLFLVQHPEVIVDIWQVMGISKVTLERTGENSFAANDGSGTTGSVKICYASQDTHVIIAEGSYIGPLSDRPLKAKCVMLLKSGYMQETNRRWYVTSRLDAFIQMENVGVEILAKTFQPLINKSADYNFAETAGFVSHVSKTAEANPAGMTRLARKLVDVDDTTRERFVELSTQVAQRAAERKTSSQVVKARTPNLRTTSQVRNKPAG